MRKITRKKSGYILWDPSYGWPANTCSNCGYTEHHDVHVSVDWDFCPKCKVKLNGCKEILGCVGKHTEIMASEEKYRD